ncbi:MAG: hypothetical protein KGJ13_04540 [Patescibacteria group bacterium]|nr:hypothetical protein [Patescibacteria group bacterium]
MMQKTETKKGVAKKAALMLAVAVGAYMVYRKAAYERQRAKEWLLKAEAEIEENLEQLKNLSEREYDRIVDTAVFHYGQLYRVNARELADAAEDLRADWERVKEEFRAAAAKAKKRVTENSSKEE